MRGPGEELRGTRLPARLAELAEPPERLFLHGRLPRGPAVAIVGRRHPSPEAVEFTRTLSANLAAAGVIILSGGAEGIDTAAHLGALDVGGLTVVVTPAGFDHPFPKKNGALFERVVDSGGGYLSLYPDDVPAHTSQFFARNGVLAALSNAVIVAQTRIRGGGRNAAGWARQLRRKLFVVPHSPWVPQGNGAILELRLGAEPLDRAEEVLKFLRESSLHPLPAAAPLVKEGPSQAELWPAANDSASDPVVAAVQAGAVHPDEIADRTGLSPATVQRRILTLTLSGVLVPGPLGSLKLVNPRID